jgi:hypothetical protein
MDDTPRPLRSVPDDDLLRRLGSLVHQSRSVEHDLVAHIAEVDARKLYAREAASSMHAYCTNVLHLSGAEAYLRIAAARASLKHPVLLTMLADGRLNLTTIGLLAPHLTPVNRDDLLARATHQSKRRILALIAALMPRPDVPAVMRKLPERRVAPAAPVLALRPDAVSMAAIAPVLALGADPVEAPPVPVASPRISVRADELRPDGVQPRAVVEPLSPGRYKVQFTAGDRLHDLLERLQALMRSTVPNGDLAALIEIAVSEKVERLEARRFGRTKAPRKAATDVDPDPSSRYIPADVKRAVSERDGYQCTFRNRLGGRCPERSWLEFHHQHPHGLGGDRSIQNICLMCHPHNEYLAELDYGREVILRHQQRSKSERAGSARSPG